MKTNAKEEFLKLIKNKKVKCAKIIHDDYFDETKTYLLKLNYSYDDMEDFLKTIDFDYDSGYGVQELFGEIWFSNGTWANRKEYDGSEWWDIKVVPEIPRDLL